MSHTYVCNDLHVVFSTKNRGETLPEDLKPTWAYLVGIAANASIRIDAVGGTRNHIHALIALPATESLSHAVNVLKSNSSKWLGLGFDWQDGYGAFAVSRSQIPIVRRYIERQAEHHARRTFDEELLSLLRKHGLPFDPKYVFG